MASDLLVIQQLFYDMFVTYSFGTPFLALLGVITLIFVFMKFCNFSTDVTILVSLLIGGGAIAFYFTDILHTIIGLGFGLVLFIGLIWLSNR